MNIFHPFDDNKDFDLDEATALKRKKKNRFIKSIIRYVLILIIWHLAATLLYGICFSSLMEQYLRANMLKTVDVILAIYSAITIFLLSFFSSADLKDAHETRRAFIEQLKGRKISFGSCMKFSLWQIVLYTAIYFVFQLPFCLFHHAYGFDHIYVTIYEQYHIMDVGFMQLTGVGILGTLINCIIFFFSLMMFHYFTYISWYKNRITK